LLIYYIRKTALTKINSIKNFMTGVASDLFRLEPKGLGKGEIFLAALIQDARIKGGGESI
jgi:hypothetical protein